MFLYASIDKEDSFYLSNAILSDFDYLNKIENTQSTNSDEKHRERSPAYIHRITQGKGTIIAYRWYSNGDVMGIDDEVFKKLTIWVSELPSQYPAVLDLRKNKEVKVVFTSGGSAWPRSACSGYLSSGSVTLEKPHAVIDVSVAATMTPAGSNTSCKKSNISIAFSATEISHDDLTPWLGLKGEHPYDETYRN